jgi:hypothetical protein
MHLWVDDIRPAPEGWTHARTCAEAQTHLATGTVERCSLDHDLGPGQDGTDLVVWIVETGHWPRDRPAVHSANPVGAARMTGLIDRYGPYNT